MTDHVELLLIEDDEDDYLLTADSLAQCKSPTFSISWAQNGDQAISLLKEQPFDLCLLDYRLGKENAIDVLAKLKALSVSIPVVVLTGQADSVVDDMVMRAGAEDFLTKSEIDTPRFMRTIRYALVRREIETERLERNRIEQQNKAKDKFLAHLGHELRTPLASILGYTEMLLDNHSNEPIQQELSTILNNSKHLLSLLNDLLDMSRIMANKLELSPSALHLASFLSDLYSLMVMQASEKGLVLTVVADSNIPEEISTDATRLRQVLINLVNNAIKFTPNGQVTIRIKASAPQKLLIFCVEDTGIGMPEDKLDKIFQPFEQIEDLMQANHGGAGLGLAITRELVNRIGGEICVESQPGKGSQFHFTIPLQCDDVSHWVTLDLEAPQRATPVSIRKDLYGNVLIVDDLRDIRRLTGSLVGTTQASVQYAKNGLEALEKIQESQTANTPFDLVLMDIHMPVMNGIDCLKALRSEGIFTPVVAVTAASRKGLRESLLEQGFDNVIAKPIDRQALSDVLIRYLHESPLVSSLSQQPASASVMVVEDDEDVADLMVILLTALGYQTTAANSARQARQLITDSPNAYDHVMVDLHLPDANGYELIQSLMRISDSLTFTIVSGAETNPEALKGLPIIQTLLKPVSREDLAQITIPIRQRR
ncbi:response regulator [Aestuariibacter sp. GS-14]|uniref:response regulator n=1 Tax=Aestuariibacter sp. GS-14 TaxID=2590670 RepID=UPI00112DE963|nr:response regulator [Aestuariibacter sp. GS-14]TPV60833.1 response regulator [Aestuariibacter sp. GS-14]